VPKIALTCKQGYLILPVVASNFLPQISGEGEFRILRKKIIMNTINETSQMEIVHKISRLGIPLVISISVPTALAVKLAEDAGITLVGAVRGVKFIVYTHEERLSEISVLNT